MARKPRLPTLWEVPDELWARIQPLLDADDPPKPTGRPKVDRRRVLDGIIFHLRTGCQWNHIPRVYGSTLPFPYSSQVEGRLRELRTQLGNMRYRVLYYGDPNRRFVLLHGVRKQTEALPEQDKVIAIQRMRRDIELKKTERGKS